MRREEMLLKIQEILVELPENVENAAESLLKRIERAGMKPPTIDSDRCQVLIQKYVDPSFSMWDEDFDKEPDLAERYKKRMNRK